ncbi:hypothetical protein SprV_0902663200 [Sparganum proliferum]
MELSLWDILEKRTLLNELSQESTIKGIYERWGGNIFVPVTRPEIVSQCKADLHELETPKRTEPNSTS